MTIQEMQEAFNELKKMLIDVAAADSDEQREASLKVIMDKLDSYEIGHVDAIKKYSKK